LQEWVLPGQHLVEHDPEREEVRPRIRGAALDHLGREIAHRAAQEPMPVHVDGHGLRRPAQVLRRDPPRDAEVEDLGAAVGREHDVLGLEVAVHDPLLGRGDEGVGAVLGDGEEGGDLEGLADPGPQGDALHQLLDDERLVVLQEDVVDRGDRVVVEGRAGARLLQQALEVLPVRVEGSFEGDGVLEERIPGAVDLGLAAAPKIRVDPVPVGDRRADQAGRTRPRQRIGRLVAAVGGIGHDS
jgi:hypothetical protein